MAKSSVAQKNPQKRIFGRWFIFKKGVGVIIFIVQSIPLCTVPVQSFYLLQSYNF